MTTFKGLELTETILTLISLDDLKDNNLEFTYGHLYYFGFTLGLINELEYEYAGKYYGEYWNIKVIQYEY